MINSYINFLIGFVIPFIGYFIIKSFLPSEKLIWNNNKYIEIREALFYSKEGEIEGQININYPIFHSNEGLLRIEKIPSKITPYVLIYKNNDIMKEGIYEKFLVFKGTKIYKLIYSYYK